MGIDFKTVLRNINGTPMTDVDGSEVTLAAICQNALGAIFPDERDLKETEKIRRARLALYIEMGLTDKFKAEDIVMLKKVVAKMYPAVVVMRAHDILEPPTDDETIGLLAMEEKTRQGKKADA